MDGLIEGLKKNSLIKQRRYHFNHTLSGICDSKMEIPEYLLN